MIDQFRLLVPDPRIASLPRYMWYEGEVRRFPLLLRSIIQYYLMSPRRRY